MNKHPHDILIHWQNFSQNVSKCHKLYIIKSSIKYWIPKQLRGLLTFLPILYIDTILFPIVLYFIRHVFGKERMEIILIIMCCPRKDLMWKNFLSYQRQFHRGGKKELFMLNTSGTSKNKRNILFPPLHCSLV